MSILDRRWSPEQLRTYQTSGFLLMPALFAPSEVAAMKGELPALFAEDSPRRVVEKDGKSVRTVFGAHTTNDLFGRIARDPRLVLPAQQVVDGDVYVYQFKINAKIAFGGDVWSWHQDFVYWRKEDGLPTPRITNAVIFLDDVTEFNGPIFFIPGSHRGEMIDVPAAGLSLGNERRGPYRDSPAWMANLVADLKYTLSRQTVADLIAVHGLASPKGPAGSVLFFDSNLAHGSTQNISPHDRAITIVTYNSVDNIPIPPGEPRPEFLVSRDRTPITPLDDGKSPPRS